MMILLLFYFASYSALPGVISALPASNDARIVGGFQVTEGLVPFMTAYGSMQGNNLSLACGGTLITPKHILTAAHCIDNTTLGADVIINSLVINQPPPTTAEVRKVAKTQVHELFKFVEIPSGEIANGFDVAILTLDKEVTTIKPVKLATESCSTTTAINGYTTALATGWGKIGPNDDISNLNYLRGTVLDLISNAEYSKIRPKFPALKGSQLSAQYTGRGTCPGDSGGPLFVGNQKDGFIQVGITSYGDADNCAFVGAGVFARVSRFFDWINIQTGGLLE